MLLARAVAEVVGEEARIGRRGPRGPRNSSLPEQLASADGPGSGARLSLTSTWKVDPLPVP